MRIAARTTDFKHRRTAAFENQRLYDQIECAIGGCLQGIVSLRLCVNQLKGKDHVVFGGNLMVGAAEGFGLLFGSSSSSPKPVSTVGPLGGRGGGLLGCGFGFGLCSSGMVTCDAD